MWEQVVPTQELWGRGETPFLFFIVWQTDYLVQSWILYMINGG